MTDVDVPFACHGRTAYFPASDALVLADLHLGRGAASNVEAPIDGGGDAVDRLADVLERTSPETVVVAGDLLHSFSYVPRGVERSLSALEAVAAAADADFVVAPGNHDAMLAETFDGETAAEYPLADGDTVVLHGHEAPERDADRYVVGHDHPALSVDGRKVPCFLYGPGAFRGSDVLVLPAFTRLAPGSTVNGMYGRDFQSPLVTDAGAFHPAIRDESADETLWFPPLKRCRSLL